MKVIELLCKLADEPLMNDVKICIHADCGKVFVADIGMLMKNQKNELHLFGKHKEKRETGIETVPQ